MSRYRGPQPHVLENYSHLFNLKPNIYKSRCLNSHFIPNKGGKSANITDYNDNCHD